MRFRLRTLLILLAVLPPVVAGLWFVEWPMPGYIFLVCAIYLLVAFAFVAHKNSLL